MALPLAIDLFHGIAKYLPTADLISLALCDDQLACLATTRLRHRVVQLRLNDAQNPTELGLQMEFLAPIIRRLDVLLTAPHLNDMLAGFIGKCVALEEMRISGDFVMPNSEEVEVEDLWRLQKLSVSGMKGHWGLPSLCSRANTGNLHSLRIERVDAICAQLPDVRHLEIDLSQYKCAGRFWQSLRVHLASCRSLNSLSVENIPQMVVIGELQLDLQWVQHLRLHSLRTANLQNCAWLATLTYLRSLDVHLDEMELEDYLVDLSDHPSYQLRKLHIRTDDSDWIGIPVQQFGLLTRLDDLAIALGADVENVSALMSGLAEHVPQLHHLQLYNRCARCPMHLFDAHWVASSFPLLQTLRIELVPASVAALAWLPQLRRLHVTVNLRRHPGAPVRQWRQRFEVGRLLVALSRHGRLTHLRLDSKSGVAVRVSSWRLKRMGEWRKLRELAICDLLRAEDLARLREVTDTRRIAWRCEAFRDDDDDDDDKRGGCV